MWSEGENASTLYTLAQLRLRQRETTELTGHQRTRNQSTNQSINQSIKDLLRHKAAYTNYNKT